MSLFAGLKGTTASSFVLLGNTRGTPGTDAYLGVSRGNQNSAQLYWNETTDKWQCGIAGSLSDIVTGSIAQYWAKAGTVISPVTANDTIYVASNTAAPAIGGATSVNGQFGISGASLDATLNSTSGSLFGQSLAGYGLYALQAGILTDNTSTPTAYILRNLDLVTRSKTATGAVLKVEDSTASTGRLFDLIKLGVSKVYVDNAGKSWFTGLESTANFIDRGGIYSYSVICAYNDVSFYLGTASSTSGAILYSAGQTPNAIKFHLPAVSNNLLLLYQRGGYNIPDFAIPKQNYPAITFVGDSAIYNSTMTFCNNKRAIIQHNATDFLVKTYTGGLRVDQLASSAGASLWHVPATIPVVGNTLTIGAYTWTFVALRAAAWQITADDTLTSVTTAINTDCAGILLATNKGGIAPNNHSLLEIHYVATGPANNGAAFSSTVSTATYILSASTLTGGQNVASKTQVSLQPSAIFSHGVEISGALTWATTPVSSTPYNPAIEDYCLMVDTSVSRSVVITTEGTWEGRHLVVKDSTGGGVGNNIVITGDAGQTFDGAANATIATAYGYFELVSKGGNWFIVAQH